MSMYYCYKGYDTVFLLLRFPDHCRGGRNPFAYAYVISADIVPYYGNIKYAPSGLSLECLGFNPFAAMYFFGKKNNIFFGEDENGDEVNKNHEDAGRAWLPGRCMGCWRRCMSAHRNCLGISQVSSCSQQHPSTSQHIPANPSTSQHIPAQMLWILRLETVTIFGTSE
jgi:hypothetical protein